MLRTWQQPSAATVNLLAVDTSTEACSCALWVDGVCREIFELAPRRHGELLLGMAEQLLADAELSVADLDALAFGRGPGSFTGVRIATGAIQGLAFALELPVAPISSLQALAQGVTRELHHSSVLAGFDARMNEVYWGAYRLTSAGVVEPVGTELVCPPDRVPVPDDGEWFGAGSAWQSYGEQLRGAVGAQLIGMEPERYPHARDLAVLGAAAVARDQVVPAHEALPVYLRDSVTHVNSGPRS